MQIQFTMGHVVAITAALNTHGKAAPGGQRTVSMADARNRRNVRRALDVDWIEQWDNHAQIFVEAHARELDAEPKVDTPQDVAAAVRAGKAAFVVCEIKRELVEWMRGILVACEPMLMFADDTVDALDAIDAALAQEGNQ